MYFLYHLTTLLSKPLPNTNPEDPKESHLLLSFLSTIFYLHILAVYTALTVNSLTVKKITMVCHKMILICHCVCCLNLDPIFKCFMWI